MKYMQFNDTGYTPCGKWRVVPTEATSEMTSAMVKARMDAEDGGRVLSEADEYGADALIAAAPTPPAELMLSGEPATWRYQDARGNYRYRKYIPGFDTEYWILKPVALYLHPAPNDSTVRNTGRKFTDDDLAEIHQLAYEIGGMDSGEYQLDGDELEQIVVKCASLFYSNYDSTVRDAERYRYVREHCYVEVQCDSPRNWYDPEKLDAAIDAAADRLLEGGG